MSMSWPTDNQPDFFVTDPARRVEPDGSRKLSGFLAGEPLPAQNFNWLQYSLSLWLRFFKRAAMQYDATIGAAGTHATLALALADAAIVANASILLLENFSGGASPIALTKAGWRIYAKPGVTMAKGSAVTGLSVDAAGVEIRGLRFSGFSTGGDTAVKYTVNGTYGRVVDCNFFNCDTEVDDALAPAGKKPALYGNLTEI